MIARILSKHFRNRQSGDGCRTTGDEAFWSMNLEGNNRQRIGRCCADPTVSPNGKQLSLVGFNGDPTGAALFTSRLDGTSVFQVTPFSFDVAVKQDWAPDGKHLVFTIYGDVAIAGVSPNYRDGSTRRDPLSSDNAFSGRGRQGHGRLLFSRWAMDRFQRVLRQPSPHARDSIKRWRWTTMNYRSCARSLLVPTTGVHPRR